MSDKHPIHTTLSTDAIRILDRYEKEMGGKNAVIEQALFSISKDTPKNIGINAIITWLEIEFIKPLLGKKIPEGSIVGIIGPTMSGKTILACAVLDNFLSRNEKRCVFLSGRNKSSYLIPITNSLGMKLGNFSEKILDICEINTLDGIFRTLQKSKPKIIVIDDMGMIRENESNNLDIIFNSSGWNILSEELKKQKTICVLISENETISRFCDIVIKMHKSKSSENPIFIKVVKNIGLIPSDIFKLEMNGYVRIVPLLKVEETSDKQQEKQNAPGSPESLKSIAEQINEQSEQTDRGKNPEPVKTEISTETLQKKIIQPKKLTDNQKKIKIALETNNGTLTRKEISEKTDISLSNLVNPLRKMEEAGIISIDTSQKVHKVLISQNPEKA